MENASTASSLLKNANKELMPFIQGRALLHPRAVAHPDRDTGSAINSFESLTGNPHGFVDKSEFLLALLAYSGNKAILRPEGSGKSTPDSKKNFYDYSQGVCHGVSSGYRHSLQN